MYLPACGDLIWSKMRCLPDSKDSISWAGPPWSHCGIPSGISNSLYLSLSEFEKMKVIFWKFWKFSKFDYFPKKSTPFLKFYGTLFLSSKNIISNLRKIQEKDCRSSFGSNIRNICRFNDTYNIHDCIMDSVKYFLINVSDIIRNINGEVFDRIFFN